MDRFLVKQLIQKDDGIGGMIEDLQTIYIGQGVLDMLTGSNENTVQNAFVEQSTHVLITEYFEDYKQVIREQMVVDFDDSRYRITYVDNPTEYDDHLEIYLKFEQHITQDELIDDYLETLLSNVVVTKGEKGDAGRDGKDGKSAFELWSVQNSGTIADFFESLKGEKGDKGDKGPKGDIGPQGPKGENGRDGREGLKGDKGDSFTFEDFTVEQLNSLKGPKGDKGEDGVDGRDGVGIAQLLSLAGNVLSISDGNAVELPEAGLSVVETGKNGNGDYILFSNNLLICWGTGTAYSKTGQTHYSMHNIATSYGNTNYRYYTSHSTVKVGVGHLDIVSVTIKTSNVVELLSRGEAGATFDGYAFFSYFTIGYKS